MVASESTPFIKTGGLADVIGALPQALQASGEEVAVVLPWYRDARVESSRPVLEDLPVWLGRTCYPAQVHETAAAGVTFYLVKCPSLFDRKGVYGDENGDFPDNHLRFALLSRAALSVARWTFRPQILHCHDWQTALVAVYLRGMLAGDPTFMGVRTLLTIHNLGYQGWFPAEAAGELGLERVESTEALNLLRGGIASSDAISTVSRRYAAEIQTPEFGWGLEGLLASRASSLTGILNGVDYSEWDPAADRHLAANYSAEDLTGKLACKRDLIEQFGLPGEAMDRPLAGIVSRLASQKGFDLVAQVAPQLAAEEWTLVVLGSGEPNCEQLFQELAAAYPAKVAVKIAYDNALAHKIEAGSDLFLMPSRYEPCGLNQIYSLRYGTVPVVRATGGLDDTIDESTGFKFKEYTGEALLATVRAALAAYGDTAGWRRLMLNGMAKDYSWRASASAYVELYRRLALESWLRPRSSIETGEA